VTATAFLPGAHTISVYIDGVPIPQT
jgi:hypothetical protein